MRRPAAFLDRDGVLNEDPGYVHRIEDFVLLPRVVPALQALQAAGFRLVIVTNQSGVARGMYTEADVHRLHDHLRGLMAPHGVHFDAIEHCPHLPDAAVPAYRLQCHCRKPAPGMILSAAQALQVDLQRSILVGDKPSDVEAGQRAGLGRCWLIGSAEAALACQATGSARDLQDAVNQALAAGG